MNMYDLIVKKKRGGALAKDEIDWMIREYTDGRIPDYQMVRYDDGSLLCRNDRRRDEGSYSCHGSQRRRTRSLRDPWNQGG